MRGSHNMATPIFNRTVKVSRYIIIKERRRFCGYKYGSSGFR